MSDNNNVENDNESDYVYLKRPYLFNIRYNSRQVWHKVLLFMVIYDDKIQSKVVIGSDGYRSLLDKCKK